MFIIASLLKMVLMINLALASLWLGNIYLTDSKLVSKLLWFGACIVPFVAIILVTKSSFVELYGTVEPLEIQNVFLLNLVIFLVSFYVGEHWELLTNIYEKITSRKENEKC